MHHIHMYAVLSGTELTTILYDSLVLTVLQCRHIFTSVECSHAVAPVKLKPDLYYEKSLRHALRQALRQGKPLSQAVASCRNGSSQKLSQVQLLRQHALRHGIDATCIATWETQVASWALANHVCFPLVALDLRQNSN